MLGSGAAGREAEFPECVALEVKTYGEGSDNVSLHEDRWLEVWRERSDAPTRKRLRQGRRRAFHLYQVLAMGPMLLCAMADELCGWFVAKMLRGELNGVT